MMRKGLPYDTKMVDSSIEYSELSFHQVKNNLKLSNQDNYLLKRQNEVLRKELQRISSRLDIQISKRMEEHKKRPWVKSEDLSNMQLQNAYKKCQIYKKQVNFYRKKFDDLGNVQKYEGYQQKALEYAKENNQLRQELKQLKKIQKIQQKGLIGIGASGYLKTVSQNQKLHEQIRILKKQCDEFRRQKQSTNRNKTEGSQYSINKFARQSLTPTINQNASKMKISRNKKIVSQSSEYNNQHNSSEKDHEKQSDQLKILTNTLNKLRDLIKKYKQQLIDKDKQIQNLKQKNIFLRQNSQHFKKQIAKKNQIIAANNEHKDNKIISKIQVIPPQRQWKRSPSQINQKSNNPTTQKTNKQEENQ